MAEKPRNKPAGKPPEPESRDGPGRLGTDDRGNVTWQWSDDDANLLADDDVGKVERIRALSDVQLEFDGGAEEPGSASHASPKELKTGYNPYDSGMLGKSNRKKKRNLRELSNWIELRKKLANKKSDDQ